MKKCSKPLPRLCFTFVQQALNIEIAIAKYEVELILVNYPQQWAEIQDILGNAYCDRIRGDD